MRAWEPPATFAEESPVTRDFAAIWQAADKVVYSRTLDSVSSARTRLERAFEPDAVRALKSAAGRDITIGGAELAGQALAAGLVDECHLFLNPIVVGGGTPALPAGVHVELRLLADRRLRTRAGSLRSRTR